VKETRQSPTARDSQKRSRERGAAAPQRAVREARGPARMENSATRRPPQRGGREEAGGGTEKRLEQDGRWREKERDGDCPVATEDRAVSVGVSPGPKGDRYGSESEERRSWGGAGGCPPHTIISSRTVRKMPNARKLASRGLPRARALAPVLLSNRGTGCKIAQLVNGVV